MSQSDDLHGQPGGEGDFASEPESALELPLIDVRERLPVTLFDQVVLAIRGDDGLIYLGVSDICAIVNLASWSQLRRIRANEDLAEGLVRAAVDTGYGIKEQYFLQLDLYPAWLIGVTTRRVSASTRGRIQHLKRYLIAEVYAAFARITGLPEASSRAIEDLRDLDQIETSLTDLTTRQQQLEESQARARHAWRDLDARVRALEGQRTETITEAQRGYLYTIVQAWGKARAERDPSAARNPYAACWATLKARFRISRYEDLPIREYTNAVVLVRAAYRQLTGEDLDIPEQSSLDL
jgi:hypothetical protein